MCKASVVAKQVVPAKVGETYGIGISSHGLGAFHAAGATTAECVACVKHGTTMIFSNIPVDLQKKHGIEANEVATFIDTGDNRHDIVKFRDGAQVYLDELADCGVTASLAIPAARKAPARRELAAV